MARKLIKNFINLVNGYSDAKVYRDAEWDEYQVEFYNQGVWAKKATYHTNDKEDALHTAASHHRKELQISFDNRK